MRYLQLEKTIEVLQGSPGFDEDRAEAARNYLLAAYADKKELPALGVLKLRLREDVGRKKGLEYAAEAGRDFVAQHGRPPKDDFELVAYMADHSKDSIREWRQYSSPEVKVDALARLRGDQAQRRQMHTPEAYEEVRETEEGERLVEQEGAQPMWESDDRPDVEATRQHARIAYYEAYLRGDKGEAIVQFVLLQRLVYPPHSFPSLHRHLTLRGLPMPKRAREQGARQIGRLDISLAHVKGSPKIAMRRIEERKEREEREGRNQ